MMIRKYILALLVFCYVFQAQADEIRVAAAANLRFVLPELAQEFEQKIGDQLAITYAASGTLTTQIQHGAPFDVFLSAAPSYIQRLSNVGLTEGIAVDYAQSQLALFSSTQSTLSVDSELQGLKQALEQGALNKVAIANPRHAPYGLAAKQVLQQAGIWQQIQPYLLIAENASQAVQFSLTPSVDAGFIPYAHSIQAKITSQGRFVKLDALLQQQAVLIQGSTESAKQFLVFIQTEQAQEIFQRHGFLIYEKN